MIRNFEDKDFDWLLAKHGTCTFLLIQVLIGSFQKIRFTKFMSKIRLKIRLQFRLFREQGLGAFGLMADHLEIGCP